MGARPLPTNMAAPAALSFHVYRLARPALDLAPPLRFDAAAFAPDDGCDHPLLPFPSPRDALTDPLGALEASPGALTVPAAVGTAYLGEPFVAALALVASLVALLLTPHGSCRLTVTAATAGL